MRQRILDWGGEVHFHSQMTDIHVEDGKLTAITVTTDAGSIRCPAEILVLAIGHSARDTFSMLYERQIPMMAKSFAVGVRVEHDQEMINCAQYGENVPYDLPAAPYKVAAKFGKWKRCLFVLHVSGRICRQCFF